MLETIEKMEIQKSSRAETQDVSIEDVYFIMNHPNPTIDLFMYGVGALCAVFILFMIVTGGQY